MGSFGERLQREREMRGITLEEIAEATKIGTRLLRALEEQDFDKLPGGIFNKGFVRAYARYLGLNEEQAVADYLAALSEAQAAGKATRQEPASNAAPQHNILITEVEEREPIRLPWGLVAAVVIAMALLYAGGRYVLRRGFPKLLPVRAATQPAANAAPKPEKVPLPSVAAAAAAENVPANDKAGFVVEVKAKQASWVSIAADGKTVVEGVLPAASEKTVRAQHSVVLKTGNAAGIEVFHNGNPVPPLGAGGRVKTVEFTATGWR